MKLILASASQTRRALLSAAGLDVRIRPAAIDEASVKASLVEAEVSPRDIADALAEAKARKISVQDRDALVLGCDQVLDLNGQLLSKPQDAAAARRQIAALSGTRHKLHSAVVAYEDGVAIWRHVGTVRLTMREVGEDYLHDYVERNWHSIRDSVGSYQLEAEGMRLFTSVEGDYFTVLGLPMLPLLSWLIARGYLAA
jgi:septum formation protein